MLGVVTTRLLRKGVPHKLDQHMIVESALHSKVPSFKAGSLEEHFSLRVRECHADIDQDLDSRP